MRVGPKDDCLLASLRLDPFCDTTSTLFSPNLTVGDMLASLRLDPFCDTTSTLFSPNLTVGDR